MLIDLGTLYLSWYTHFCLHLLFGFLHSLGCPLTTLNLYVQI